MPQSSCLNPDSHFTSPLPRSQIPIAKTTAEHRSQNTEMHLKVGRSCSSMGEQWLAVLRLEALRPILSEHFRF